MTAANKRKTIAAIRKVAKWMSDPRHRVKDWTRMISGRAERPCRTCIIGAFFYRAHVPLPKIVDMVAMQMRPRGTFVTPWTTAELRKLFRESIKAVEAA